MSGRWRGLGWLLTFAAFVTLPRVTDSVTMNRYAIVLYLAVGVLSVVLLTGLNHQVSLGQSAFFGVGAYATAILVGTHGWPYWLAIPLGAAVSFVIGVIVGLPALRLKGHYLALVTLGVAVVFPQVVNRFASLTGGNGGLSVNKRLRAPQWTHLTHDQWGYYLLLAIAVLMFVLVRNITSSRVGRALRASANETAARSSGVDVAFYRVITFGMSAAVAAVAGGMYTIHNRFVGSSDFGLLRSIDFLAAMVVGGGTLVAGAVIGGMFLQFAPEYTHKFGVDPALTPVVYAVLLLLCVFFFPDGITGGAVRLTHAIKTRLRARPTPPRVPVQPQVRVSEEPS